MKNVSSRRSVSGGLSTSPAAKMNRSWLSNLLQYLLALLGCDHAAGNCIDRCFKVCIVSTERIHKCVSEIFTISLALVWIRFKAEDV